MWRAAGPGTELNRALNRAFADAAPTAASLPAQNRASFEVPFEPEAHGVGKQHLASSAGSRAAGSARTILASAHLSAPPASQPAVLSPTHASPRPPLPSGPHHHHARQQQQQQQQQASAGAATQHGAAQEEHALAYEQWRAHHPCVLQRLGEVQASLAGKRLAIFLDYDGTLTPIVSNPDEAILSQQMRDVVRSVAQLFPTAIISGRGREKVENFVQLKELYYAGSHGMDIAGPLELRGGGNMAPADMAFQPAAHFRPLIDAVYQELLERLAPIPGSSVEHNTFCVSAHFRNCSAERWQEVVQVAEDVVAHNPELRMTRGRKVVEVRPKVNWHKGTALDHLLGALGLRGCPDVVAIYIGDDHTDEDAFRVLRDTQQGFGVLVSSKVRDTAATYTARDPADVQAFLQSLVAWGATEQNGWLHYHQSQQGGGGAGGQQEQPQGQQGHNAPPGAGNGGAAASPEGAGSAPPHAQQQQQQEPQLQQQQQGLLSDGDGGGGALAAGPWHGLLSLVGSPPQATPISG